MNKPKAFSLPTAKCKRCNHRWTPRQSVPTICPACKSRKWNIAKKVAA